MSQEEGSLVWEVLVTVILSKQVYMYMCPIQNGYLDRDILLYSSKIVDKKEILRTVPNTVNYCSSDKDIFSIIPPSTSMHYATNLGTWRVVRLYSVQCTVQWNSSISETVRNRTHVRMTDTLTSQNIDISSWDIKYICMHSCIQG
jgi:hypothetical protein